MVRRSPCLTCSHGEESKHGNPICEQCEDRVNYANSYGAAGAATPGDVRRSLVIVKDDRINMEEFKKLVVRNRVSRQAEVSAYESGRLNFNAHASEEFGLLKMRSVDIFVKKGTKVSIVAFKFSETSGLTYRVTADKTYSCRVQNIALVRALNLGKRSYKLRKHRDLIIAEIEH